MALQNILSLFGLLILVWNAGSIKSNLTEFKHYISKAKPNIVCVCETWLRMSDKFDIQNYKVFRNDRFGRGGGVAILIEKSIICQPHDSFFYFDGGLLETLVVQVQIDDSWADICVMYNPCKSIAENELLHYFENLSENAFICGDLNAHHPIWSVNSTSRTLINSTGSALAGVLLSNTSFNLLTPPGTVTHLDKKFNSHSTIDLAFGAGIFATADRVEVGDMLGSDHFPVVYCYKFLPNIVENDLPITWNLNGLNWKCWKDKLKQNFNGAFDVGTISDILIATTKQFTTLKSRKVRFKQQKPFWTEDCSFYIAQRRRAQKVYERFPNAENKRILNRQTAITKRFILRAKRDKWHEYCNSLNFTVPTSKVWKFFKQMNGRPVFDFSYPILSHNTPVVDNMLISDIFADFYAETFNRHIMVDNLHRKNMEVQAASQLDYETAYNMDFTLPELKSSISTLNINSAMGIDNIHNKFFHYFPEILLCKLLYAFNLIWRSGNIPPQFKVSTLIPILKPGKSPSSVESYRPIALLSCFSKLFEKIIYNRLYTYIENKNCIPHFQCGFRRMHSCNDILIYFEHFIQLTLRSQKVLIIVFFDIEKAFDSSSHLEILYNLYRVGVKGRMLRWFIDFFSGRMFNVRIGSKVSGLRSINNGVPQGSILSPLLFSILQLAIPPLDKTHILQYADDLSIFVVDKSLDEALYTIQSSIDKLNRWYQSIGLKINQSKIKFMIFTRK